MAAIDGLNGYSSPLEPVTQTVSSTPTATQTKPASAAVTTADQASLSSAGTQIAAGGATTSDVRFEKVAALHQAIAAGSYNVPSSAVADKLIDSLQR